MTSFKTRLSPQDLSDLTHLSHLLHLAHHRNKNQHHRAHWYRHFSIFRKTLLRLVNLYTALNAVPDTHAARHRKIALDKATVTEVETKLQFFADVLVFRCHLAFSQLVADLRFAVLGVVLIASLSQVCGLLGITTYLGDVAEVEVGEVLRRFEREEWGEERGVAALVKGVPRGGGGGVLELASTDEDVGEVVQRSMGDSEDIDAVEPGVQDADAEDSANERTVAPPFHSKIEGGEEVSQARAATVVKKRQAGELAPEPKRKKKKRKGGDAIDDLFAGL